MDLSNQNDSVSTNSVLGYYDAEKSKYWEKNEPMVIGDLRNRPPLLEMLGDISGHDVLEAGCGTGYVARMLAEKGAYVHGCDISEEMLAIARKSESEHPLGIKYAIGDIMDLPYPDDSMDEILSFSVTIYLSQEEILKFFCEAKRVLKPGGCLALGVTHPFMFGPDSPNINNSGKSWSKYVPLEPGKPFEESQRFQEDYIDKNGQAFSSIIWHHTADTYKKLMEKSGLKVKIIKDQIIQKEDLISAEWGTSYGYPGFLHIIAIKE